MVAADQQRASIPLQHEPIKTHDKKEVTWQVLYIIIEMQLSKYACQVK